LSPLKIDVVTIFPELFPGPLAASIPGRALERGPAQVGMENHARGVDDRAQRKLEGARGALPHTGREDGFGNRVRGRPLPVADFLAHSRQSFPHPVR